MNVNSLEALKEIARIYGETNSLEGTYDLVLKIKHDLERLEQLEKENQELKEKLSAIEFWNERYMEHNEKLKIAIFIVYMKNVDLELLKDCCNLKDYNNRVNFLRELTQQEYELLKEVLGE